MATLILCSANQSAQAATFRGNHVRETIADDSNNCPKWKSNQSRVDSELQICCSKALQFDTTLKT